MATQTDNLARKQIYIPAVRPQEELALRVAAYCRVSSDSEDQLNSFAAQTTHYHQLIANHESWLLVDIYADEGITGTSAQKRKDFQRLLADCRKGKIDKILPFQRKKNNGEHVKYSVTNTNPAIIPQATFEAVQMRIQDQFKLRQAKPGQLPLAGKVICGKCGAACVVRYNKGKEYISCRTHDYAADKCALKPIRAEEICSAFFRLYDNLKHNPGILQIIIEKLNWTQILLLLQSKRFW